MKTKTLVEEEKLDEPTQEEVGHVHGPHCQHGQRLAPVVRQTAKVGRNDDCPCGSQKKFKKCCGK